MGRAVVGQTKTFGIELGSVANAGKFQVNPTLDAADFRISINGGAFAALTNTPTVTPSGGAQVVIVLAAAETTSAGAGGRIHLRCSDSSGNEWQDVAVEIEVFATAEDTLVTLADNAISASKIASDAITAAKIADGAIDAATFAAGAITATVIANDAITAAKIATNAIDADAIASDAITELQNGLATSTAVATLTAYVDTEVGAIKTVTDALPDSGALTGIINNITAILDDTSTSGVKVDAASKTGYSLVNDQSSIIIGTVNELGAQAKSDINNEILDVLNVDTFVESSSVPAATSTLIDKIRWLFTISRNKITQTATTQTLRNDADSGNVATSAVSDNGTTMTRGEWS